VPRPFKNPKFASKLPQRTASAATTGFKRTVKQILTLERERVGGGDGFLSAAQTAAKARGEPIEPAKKKKKENPVGKKKVPRRSGVSTPMTLDDESVMSGTATPFDEDEEMEVEAVEGGKEVITCE
jgi:INO80 complex subunit C